MLAELQRVLADYTQPFVMRYDCVLNAWIVEQDGKAWKLQPKELYAGRRTASW